MGIPDLYVLWVGLDYLEGYKVSSKTSLEEIAKLPFHRKGGVNFDCAYAVRIWDAQNRIALNKMIELEPNKRHDSPDGLLHYIPNDPE
jgi:hypothetical protein